MPGSIKVAIQKLARTNRNIMPLYIGTATENCSESQGHLKERKVLMGHRMRQITHIMFASMKAHTDQL